jgi:uncharacterized protein YxjI
MFSNGFDITTPVENLSTKRSPFGETLVLNASGTQIARVAKESLVSGAYNIIIAGGGFYQFDRDKESRRTWACKGEGRLLHLSEDSRRKFEIADGNQRIAECWKEWGGNYSITLLDETELKLVICIVLALSLREDQSSDPPVF